MEAQHAQREMQLQCREAVIVDHGQLAEMVLARSLALDQREKLLAQKERALSEASTRAFSRCAEGAVRGGGVRGAGGVPGVNISEAQQ